MALASCRGGTAAELPQDPPDLELGIGGLAWGAEPGMTPVGVFLRGGLVPPPVRGADIVMADIALIAQRNQARGGQVADNAPDPGRGQAVHRAGQRPRHPHDVAAGARDDLQVHPVLTVLAGVEGRSAATRSIGIKVPPVTRQACPAYLACRRAWRSFGVPAASSATVSVTYMLVIGRANTTPPQNHQYRRRPRMRLQESAAAVLGGSVIVRSALPGLAEPAQSRTNRRSRGNNDKGFVMAEKREG